MQKFKKLYKKCKYRHRMYAIPYTLDIKKPRQVDRSLKSINQSIRPVLPCLKIDLLLDPAMAEELGKYIHWPMNVVSELNNRTIKLFDI